MNPFNKRQKKAFVIVKECKIQVCQTRHEKDSTRSGPLKHDVKLYLTSKNTHY